ncbi:hypothetical protein LQE22_004285 [Klebsiella oxytoca]|nr:hypothetical protein [Klebsiella oxytoca]
MNISEDIVPGASTHTGPVLVYLECGEAKGGFLLMPDEFVTSLAALEEVREMAGLSSDSFKKMPTDL